MTWASTAVAEDAKRHRKQVLKKRKQGISDDCLDFYPQKLSGRRTEDYSGFYNHSRRQEMQNITRTKL